MGRGALARSESLAAALAVWVGEIAVKREARVLHQRIDAEMKPFGRLAPLRDLIEGAIELREVAYFHHQMKITEIGRR